MAPIARRVVPKIKFPGQLEMAKTQPYHDPAARGAGHSIRCIAWNPLGTLIATGAADRTLRVWNPDKASVRYSTDLRGHAMSVEKVAFNPVKDAELCSVSADGVLKIWDVRTKACINEVTDLGSPVSLIWHPEGTSLIVGNKVCELKHGHANKLLTF